MRIKANILLSILFVIAVGLAISGLFSPGFSGEKNQTIAASAIASWPPPDPSDPKGEKLVLAENPLADNYYLVVDFSGSMDDRACGGRESKSDVVKRVLPEFVLSIPSQANIGLLAFDRWGVKERVPIDSAQKNREKIFEFIKNAKPSSGTPLSTAVQNGYEKLVEQARRQHGYGRYRLVIITDGEANLGYNPKNQVDYIANNSPVIIDTIGFCIGKNHSLNQPGKTVYREANSPEALRAGLKEVLAETPIFDAKKFK